MVAQIACVHAQGFGIICVSLHHIVAKAPCIARGTMLKPGHRRASFDWYVHGISCFWTQKKRPKLLKFGRFVYIFVYFLRKTLISKVYCGETGIRTLDTVTRMPHFECGPFDHSGISPLRGVLLCLCHAPEGGGGGRGAIPFEAQSYCNLFIPTNIGAKKRPLGRVFLFSGQMVCAL